VENSFLFYNLLCLNALHGGTDRQHKKKSVCFLFNQSNHSIMLVTLSGTVLKKASPSFFSFSFSLFFIHKKKRMAHVFSYLRHNKKSLSGALLLSFIYAIYKVKQTHFGSKKTKEQGTKTKVGVNKTFFEQMKKLMPICIPGKEKKSLFSRGIPDIDRVTVFFKKLRKNYKLMRQGRKYSEK
jgi:hypothetical protein